MCTSTDKQIAIHYCLQNFSENLISVLLRIKIQTEHNYFVLDTEDYHAFLSEKEVIMQEGLKLKIKDIQKVND